MGDMTRAGLAASLEKSLMDSASVFGGEFGRLLDCALEDYSRRRPRVLAGKLQLEPGRITYPCPADYRALGAVFWASAQRQTLKPWQPGFPVRLPRLSVIHTETGRQFMFDVPPTSDQIGCYGAEYPYTYHALHALGDDSGRTTVPEHDRGLLLLRATAEAMREMSMRNVKKPISTQDTIGGQTRTGTPGALFEIFMEAFEKQVCRD